jgi:hypothetical protein
MPITRYLEKGLVFAPQALLQWVKRWRKHAGRSGSAPTIRNGSLSLSSLSGWRRKDGDLDAAALRDKAVAAMGGVAYSALCASQTSNPHAAAE